MSERDLLITDLVAEVLGPRGGPHETLRPDEDPVDEYIAGVLAPWNAASVAEDAAEELVGEDSPAADDQTDVEGQSAGLDLGNLPSPSLDPRSRPASLGLSFILEAVASPVVDLCCTWARYVSAGSGSWQRKPLGQQWSAVDCSNEPQLTATADSGIRVQVRCSRQGNRWRVSVFLVNNTSCGSDRPSTQEFVFQPQIRVVCASGVKLIALEPGGAMTDPEERSLALLYKEKAAYARGHLCSAMWAAMDPERPDHSMDAPQVSPFFWADGEAVFGSAVRAKYSPADVRTEYVPVVPIGAPEMQWPAHLPRPVLDPERLAETWEAGPADAALSPLATGYATWIKDQEAKALQLVPAEQLIAKEHLAKCGQALERMEEGIRLIVTDPDIRLAFCFANRAMALQSQWSKGTVNEWRPFQIAFQLMNLAGIADRDHIDRGICDLLWFPTGGGKTEAYLGLAAFTLALRRLRADRTTDPRGGAGVSVLSRYTLRLLTIQQFRRALTLITACEYLRVLRTKSGVGWRPGQCTDQAKFLWGTARFSLGLWVGGSITPNGHHDIKYMDRATGKPRVIHGALSILEGRGKGDGEPAQVLTCPACDSTLAVPPAGFQKGQSAVLHFVLGDVGQVTVPSAQSLDFAPFTVTNVDLVRHYDRNFGTLVIAFNLVADASADLVDGWFRDHIAPSLGSDAWLASARASRPGYFIRRGRHGRSEKALDFEIFCPNPACQLNSDVEWSERTPAGPWEPIQAFVTHPHVSSRCPIPAWTIDEQVYHRTPSMLIATVDKFARLAYEPRAAAIFGNVERFNHPLGYYRAWCPPRGPGDLPTSPEEDPPHGSNVSVARLLPPDLIIQDELHLIEGPLGTMVGIYESIIDTLAAECGGVKARQVKYIASTATVRQASQQVQSVFLRDLAVFPQPGLTIDDSFFAKTTPLHPLEDRDRSRLYVGISAPGRGAQTPIIRIWSRLLQHAEDRLRNGAPPAELDRFWTLVGYFNAMRELAGAVALFRQDIVQRLTTASHSRALDETEPLELSSNTNPLQLPALLKQLEDRLGGNKTPVNAAVATSMFGTGVDVDRLGLMVVHGQPKTTSAYIQATGRVGRHRGGCVVTFLRAGRPRDLNHYEFFSAYHTALHRHVEPITVHPFAPRARDRALGPVTVAMLRQAAQFPGGGATVQVDPRWRIQQKLSGRGNWYCLAHEMDGARSDSDVRILVDMLERRAQQQPGLRQPPVGVTQGEVDSELDRWAQMAARLGSALLYYESTLINPPAHPVLLGDLDHVVANWDVAYEDAPNSLREVEATTTFKGWR